MRAFSFVGVISVALAASFSFSGTAHADEGHDDVQHWMSALTWRAIGPARGGRAQTVCGVVGDTQTYYMGATGGGVWKTTNAGARWENISDGYFKTGSVGAIAVADSDPNVVFVGMGESCVRGNFSHGDGVYKSLDAGKTWDHVGLDDTRQIGDVAIHPTNPDVVFVAALGHVFGPNAQRGVFKSTDGGATWRNTLYVNDRTGAVDLSIDPHNPRVMYAGMWRISRSPWRMDSGGEGSGLYRSTDGGETWTELTDGLPKGVKGKIGVAASPAQRDLVYAIVEAEDGGVFRSRDGGDSWSCVSEDRSLRQRAWYYSHIEADPAEPDTVYVLNVQFKKSIDGGRTWSNIRVPHGDNHDLWIDPNDPKRMINANDGGANVSFDGGATWSTQTNQPTAQFYHVTTDNQYPYRVYGAQQDNSTASVSSQAREFGNWQRDLYPVGGGESGYIAVHPENPDIVYAGSYGGYLTRYDHSTGESRNIMIWPVNPMGAGAEALEHRFQWTFPIVISSHDPDTVFVGGESMFRSDDGGETWEQFSPDLTTDDKSKQRSSGGPITQDNTSVEYYCTIFTIAESPIEEGVIWAGSDDGLIHVTRDDGDNWSNVTPQDMGDWPLISMIEASPHDVDTAYAAVNRYKMDDFTPYVYRTRDGGESWTLIADGIDDGAFVRSVREDPIREGLLYAATETGVYVSFDAGEQWTSLQLDLPITPLTDLVVKGNDLVVATQGRSFWILEDLDLLRQLDGDRASDEAALFEPATADRQGWGAVSVYFNLPASLDTDASLVFLSSDHEELRAFPIELASDDSESGRPNNDRIEAEPGMNRFAWNMRLEDPVEVPGAVAWPPHPPGPRVAPGLYAVELRIDDSSIRHDFEIRGHPGVGTTQSEYDEQFELLQEIHDALSRAHTAVNDIRAVRTQIDTQMKQAKDAGVDGELREAADALRTKLSDIEEVIIQTKSKSAQDPLNYPIKLNDQIGALAYVVDGDYPPTEPSYEAFDMLNEALQEQLDALNRVMKQDVPAFNKQVERQRVPAIVVPSKKDDGAKGEIL